MRRMHRLAVLAALLLAAPALSGCENFDPDKLDVFGLNEKKKLPGERKALFPEGVPGVAQGVPPEYLKGNQPAPDAAANADVSLPAGSKVNPGDQDASAALKPEPEAKPAAKTAAVEPAETPKPKAKRKPKPAAKPATAQHAPAQVTIQPAAQGQPQASPWPAQNQQPQQAQSPWPDANQTNNASPWPAPPAPAKSQ
jgi:hypothetical protein